MLMCDMALINYARTGPNIYTTHTDVKLKMKNVCVCVCVPMPTHCIIMRLVSAQGG